MANYCEYFEHLIRNSTQIVTKKRQYFNTLLEAPVYIAMLLIELRDSVSGTKNDDESRYKRE